MGRELAVTSPDGKNRTIVLEGSPLSLGRSSANELCYPEDIGLSRQHMAIEPDGDEWTVRDLGSKNGTFLNGVRVGDKRRLKAGGSALPKANELAGSAETIAPGIVLVSRGAAWESIDSAKSLAKEVRALLPSPAIPTSP